MTLDRYGHLMEGLDEGVADKLDDLFVAPGERQMRDILADVLPLE